MSDKQKQMESTWKVSEGLDRVRGKIRKRDADNKSSALLNEYKNGPYKNKKEEIETAWVEHENAEKSAKAQDEKLTAKQIKDFMQEQNG